MAESDASSSARSGVEPMRELISNVEELQVSDTYRCRYVYRVQSFYDPHATPKLLNLSRNLSVVPGVHPPLQARLESKTRQWEQERGTLWEDRRQVQTHSLTECTDRRTNSNGMDAVPVCIHIYILTRGKE